jgi:hypothetical protein
MQMKSTFLAAWLTAVVALPVIALAQQTAPTVVAEPGKGVTATQTVEGHATVTAIDYTTRKASLRNEAGEVFDIVAGPEAVNFDKVTVGDVVAVTYTESVAARIAASGEATPGLQETVSAPQPGAGGRELSHQVTASLKVEAVDTKANTVTVSDASGARRTINVVNPQVQERLKTVKVGDIVVMTYTESLAVRIEKVPAK